MPDIDTETAAPEAAETAAAGTETAAAGDNTQQPGGSESLAGGAGNDSNTDAAAAGAPESYDFQSILPEGMAYDEKAADAFGAVARECNLTQEQASKIATHGMEYARGLMESAFTQVNEKWVAETRQQLGTDFDATMAKVGRAMNRLDHDIPGLRNAMNQTGAGNRIEVVRLMAAVGDLLSEDGGNGNGGAASGRDAEIYGKTNFDLYK